MAFWRDPLDELIDDLERAVPAAAANPYQMLPRAEDLHWLVSMILWRDKWDEEPTDEEIALLEANPRYQMVMRQLADRVRPRLGDRRRS
jgi:hypothetical protein